MAVEDFRLTIGTFHTCHLQVASLPPAKKRQSPCIGAQVGVLCHMHLYSLMGAVLQAQGLRGIDRSSVSPRAQKLGLV